MLTWHRKHAGYYHTKGRTILDGRPIDVEIEVYSTPWNDSESTNDVWWGFEVHVLDVAGKRCGIQLCDAHDTQVNTYHEAKDAVASALQCGWRFTGHYYCLEPETV